MLVSTFLIVNSAHACVSVGINVRVRFFFAAAAAARGPRRACVTVCLKLYILAQYNLDVDLVLIACPLHRRSAVSTAEQIP